MRAKLRPTIARLRTLVAKTMLQVAVPEFVFVPLNLPCWILSGNWRVVELHHKPNYR